jgi:hypothetical protein
MLAFRISQTAPMTAGGASDLLSSALQVAGQSRDVWIGALRDDSNPPWGWSWVDGTPASNLNCGSLYVGWCLGALFLAHRSRFTFGRTVDPVDCSRPCPPPPPHVSVGTELSSRFYGSPGLHGFAVVGTTIRVMMIDDLCAEWLVEGLLGCVA